MNRAFHSPLFVWFLLLATLVGAAVVLSRIDPIRVHVEQRQKELPKKIEKVKRAKKEVDVVFFGDSLMQFAIPRREDDISKAITTGMPAPRAAVKVVNLAMDGRTPLDLARRSDQILGLKPKLVIIQVEMVVNRPPLDRDDAGFIQQQRERLKNWIRYARSPLLKRFFPAGEGSGKKKKELLDALSSPAQVDIKLLKGAGEDPTAEESLEQINMRRARERWQGQTVRADSRQYKICREFIRRARSQDTRVLIVETPVSETASNLATKQYLQERRELVLSLLDGDAAGYLQYPEILADKYFDDYSHTNRKGEKVFFAWLAQELAQRLVND
jgi:hypothetical protein